MCVQITLIIYSAKKAALEKAATDAKLAVEVAGVHFDLLTLLGFVQ